MDREEELCFTYKTDEEPCGYVDTRRKRQLTSEEYGLNFEIEEIYTVK